ncbi:hypothetical protein [Fibrella aquatilis]|uniref:Uncharacterized protein n=1 Tax=Fibrella aquatilis TaxID=2817059 RepID=A0A939JUC1_9BACT|nr:hypothetical protein [Fibrella aquatilis]MBO0929632.1 hypothetical protein [Fibrella aquatilis]
MTSTAEQEFTVFYRAYAASLWGMILHADMAPKQSELILINTLTRAWQQRGQPPLPDQPMLSWLLGLAQEEGLPTAPLLPAVRRVS